MWKWEANIQVLRTFVQVILKNFDLREGLFKAPVCCRLRWAALLLLSPGTQYQSRLGTFLYIFTHHQQYDLKCILIGNLQNSTLKSYFFGGWDFSTFFFNHMSQKYQNEKSPILNGQKKSKTSEKVQKMRDLEGPTSFRPFENTL